MVDFQTEAHIDEYIIDSETLGTFSASDRMVTYTNPAADSTISIPTHEIEAIRFERNTTLHGYKLLGVFFVIVALVLTIGTTVGVYLSDIETLNEMGIAVFVYLFAIGAWYTAYDYLKHDNHDVIDLYIDTDDEVHLLCGSVDDTDFVDACEQLSDSEIPTTNRNPKLASELT